MPDYGVSGEKKGGIWVKSGVIGGENSRKPVFGFRLLEGKEFCKGLRPSENLSDGLFIQKNQDKIIKSNAFINNDATPAAFNKK